MPMIPVFHEQYVRGTGSGAGATTSQPFEASGNRAVLSVITTNFAGTDTPVIRVILQGSYDGLAWEDTNADVTVSAFGHGSASEPASGGGLDYAWLRVLVKVHDGTDVTAIIDATVVLSSQ